jgi:hypothetical protein
VPDTVHLLAMVALGQPAETPTPEKRPLETMIKFETW